MIKKIIATFMNILFKLALALLGFILIIFLVFCIGQRIGVIGGAKKPNIYLYPEKYQQINVKVSPKGWITRSIPQYNDCWEVGVSPDGKVENKFDFLFYEANIIYKFSRNKGWVFKKNEFNQKMPIILGEIGLKGKELEDFMNYWGNELKWKQERYAVYYLSLDEINEAIPLDILQKPDSILRAFFYFVPLKNEITLEEPKIESFQRKGFTVVEWGGFGE